MLATALGVLLAGTVTFSENGTSGYYDPRGIVIHSVSIAAEANAGANSTYHGFDVCEDYDNQDEVQKRTKSVYCHELTRSCFPHLRIPCLAPSLWGGMIRSSKKQFLPQSFFESEDFDVVYDSFYSELH